MSRPTTRFCTGCLAFCVLALLASGCGEKTVAPAPVPVVQEASDTPNVIELSDPKVSLVEPALVQFEVKYRFAQGKPNKYYSCDISFPGTSNHGVRMMDSWELKGEGVIKDRIVLSKPPVESFEIQVSEAPTPRDRYQKISNVVSGLVQP